MNIGPDGCFIKESEVADAPSPSGRQGVQSLLHRKYLNRMRGGMVAAILLFGLFGLLEVLTLPPAVYHQTLLVRLAVVLPVLLAVWAATYRPYLFGHMEGTGNGRVLGAQRRGAHPLARAARRCIAAL